MRLVFLGTGTSHGVPMIGCSCSTCQSQDPRDQRTNASLLIDTGSRNILIDCGRDFRLQALRERLNRIDHLLLTHPHFDHIAGIDDLRVFHRRSVRGGRGIPIYGLAEHLDYIKRHIYHYLFDSRAQLGGGITQVEPVPVDGPFEVEGILFEPLPVLHGKMQIFGYRFSDIAYISDVSHIPEQTLSRLEGLRALVVDALRFRTHSTHFNIRQALEIVAKCRPEQTYFTHICHDLSHEVVDGGFSRPTSGYYTPDRVNLAYDGLSISV